MTFTGRSLAVMEAIALYDYEAKKEGRLSIKKDDKITNVKEVYNYICITATISWLL